MLKKLLIPLVASLVVLAAACKSDESTLNDTSTDTTVTDTSMTSTTSVTATSTTTTSASTLSAEDQEFVTKAAQGGLGEVQLGQLAGQNAASADVKSFGQMMVTDHGQANTELQTLAQSKGVTLPTSPNEEMTQLHHKLMSLSGAEFDKEYMKAMVEDHQKDLEEFQKASTAAMDPEVKAFAAKNVPVLQKHLDSAKETAQKVGAQ